MNDRVSAFFDAFRVASDTLDTETLAGCFADAFLTADPAGARPVTRDLFLQALPRRAQMFADAGVGRAALTDLRVQALDDHYRLVRTEWSAPRTDGGDPVLLSSSFLLHDDGEAMRIVLYLNHQGLT
ncbi:DUF4440 domain-containing protein [Dactylosporangium sucinum]|uniref:SnoaL-like domain-containing protein n=1 Tax=Dactylosporangium sucinum TaxID=1424081 RepID=A0A917U0I3_9ACTN|nr:hypothetical protein [Dactylosporangium sucinum]GGM48278.1 hypothetical protein GCM10007977_057320 [Dactylosporangium sucinum]